MRFIYIIALFVIKKTRGFKYHVERGLVRGFKNTFIFLLWFMVSVSVYWVYETTVLLVTHSERSFVDFWCEFLL